MPSPGLALCRRITAVAAALTMMIGAAAAGAGNDMRGFLNDVGAAYDHYRQAMFYLRTGNPSVASFDLEQMRDKWAGLIDRYAAAPPPPFAADPLLADSLSGVAAAIDSGLELAAAGEAEASRTALAPVRAMLSDLRRRNDIYTRSDCIDEFSEAADALWRFRHAPPDFGVSQEVNALRRSAAVVEHHLQRCRALAEPIAGAGEEFSALFDGAGASISSLWPAIDDGDEQRVINILREFRSFDQMIYLRYG